MTRNFTGKALAALALCVFTAAGTTQAQPSGPPVSRGGKISFPGNSAPPGLSRGGKSSDKRKDWDRDRGRGKKGKGKDRDRHRDWDRHRGHDRHDHDDDDWSDVAVPLALGAAAIAISNSQAPVYAAPAYPPPAYPAGAPMNPVAALQMQLNNLGYNAGPPDGIYGAGTRNAVAQFQAANGLVPDGIAGPATQAHLAAMAGY